MSCLQEYLLCNNNQRENKTKWIFKKEIIKCSETKKTLVNSCSSEEGNYNIYVCNLLNELLNT